MTLNHIRSDFLPVTDTPKVKRILPAAKAESTQDYPRKIRFEIWGEEVIEKKVMLSASSGRVYLPPGWVGHKVKIIRID